MLPVIIEREHDSGSVAGHEHDGHADVVEMRSFTFGCRRYRYCAEADCFQKPANSLLKERSAGELLRFEECGEIDDANRNRNTNANGDTTGAASSPLLLTSSQ